MPLHGNINSWIFQNNSPAIFGGGETSLYQAGSPVGNTLPDDSGNGYDADIYNPCPNFEGSGYIDYGSSTAQISGALTICAYIKGNATGITTCGFGRGGTSNGNKDYLLGITSAAAGVLTFSIATDANTYRSLTYSLPDHNTVVHHVMGVYSPSNYLRIYVDGVQVAESTISVPSSQYTATAQPFVIGQTSDEGENFVGQIFDVKVYSAIKTYAEVIANNTTDLEFWDMLNSIANLKTVFGRIDAPSKSFAITGQVGSKLDYGFDFPQYQNKARYTGGYTRVNYTFPVAGGKEGYEVFIPYDTSGVSQYAAYGPVWNAAETVVEVPYDAGAVIQNWPDRFKFNTDTALLTADQLDYLFKPDGTARVIPYDRLIANIGDYFIVTLGTNQITALSITGSVSTYAEMEVFILWGQSNMVGVGEDTPSETGDLNTHVYTEAGLDLLNFTDNNNQYPEVTTQHGIEIALSERLYTLRSEVNTFVKVAKGNINMESNSGWNMEDGMYNYYDVLLRSIDETLYWVAKDLGKKPVLNWIIQHQGESDAVTEVLSLAFQSNLGTFYADLESHIGDTSVKKLLINIGDTAHTYYQNVRDAIDAFVLADSDAYSVDGALYELKADNVHHTSTGLNALGIACANLIDAT